MGLKPKFFAVILFINALLAGAIYVFLTWNFERSFSNYLNQRELRMLDTFAAQLEIVYEEQGSWDIFKNNPVQWNRFTFQTLANDFRRREPSRPDARNRQPLNDLENNSVINSSVVNNSVINNSRFGQRLRRFRDRSNLPVVLFDADKAVIAGQASRSQSDNDFVEKTLSLDGKTIGYVTIPVRPSVRDYLDHQFVADQSSHFILIVIAVLIGAIITATVLALFLIKRITGLVGHVKNLSAGHYDSTIAVTGSDELSTLCRHISDLGSTLKNNTQQRKQWVADISHELRTPVAILQADLEAIEDGVRELNQSSIGRLQNHVSRLKSLIDDLHELSLSDSGSMSYHKSELLIVNVIDEAVQLMQSKFDNAKLQLGWNKNSLPTNIKLLGDEKRLLQLLLNLLENALKYTDETSDKNQPGQVNIQAYVSQQKLVVEIEDSSPSVEADQLIQLTDRLFRVDASRNRDKGGSGLGLAICKNIVDAHQGKLHFSQSELGGLKVTMTFPTL